MNAHFHPSRRTATIIGYRRLCDQLEAENENLKHQIQELRSRLCGRSAPALASFHYSQTAPFSLGQPAAADAAGASQPGHVG